VQLKKEKEKNKKEKLASAASGGGVASQGAVPPDVQALLTAREVMLEQLGEFVSGCLSGRVGE
jgi:hypothetical protein